MIKKAKITAISHWVPENLLTNKDLEKMVDTNDEWIRTRTGISERHILEKGKGTSDMGVEAVKLLCEQRGMDPLEIDAIIVATITPDMFFPNAGNLIQAKLGAKNAMSFDVSAACSGFIYALSIGAQYIRTGEYKKVVVVGADTMSSITDYTDRNTCILFGDAAGAVLLEPTEDEKEAIIDFSLNSDGLGTEALHMYGGGSLHPATAETVEKRMHYLYQDGKTVFKMAVQKMAEVSVNLLHKHNYTGDDLKLFVPHQANLRIVEAAVRRLKIDPKKAVINIGKYGNTTAATIPMALSEAYQDGRVKKGDLVLFGTFGGGYTWASALLRWAMN